MLKSFKELELQIPENLSSWERARVEDIRSRLNCKDWGWSYTDGAYRWDSNGVPIPPSTFVDAWLEIPEGQKAAHDAYAKEAIYHYISMRALNGYSDEEKMEARSALGTKR